MSVRFDTLRATEVMTQAGIAETHAKAIVAMMSDAIGDQVATNPEIAGLKRDVTGLKADVAQLKRDVTGLKADVAQLKRDVAGLKTDVAELKTEMGALRVDVAAIRTEIAEMKAVLTWRIVLALGVFAALTRLMP